MLRKQLVIPSKHIWHKLIILVNILLIGSACTKTITSDSSPWLKGWTTPTGFASNIEIGKPSKNPFMPPARAPGDAVFTPTPDAPHPIPNIRTEIEQYVVQSGDTLGEIGLRFGVSVDEISRASDINNPNVLNVGQVLIIPVPLPEAIPPYFKIIPDSEFVAGPYSSYFKLDDFIEGKNGYLNHHNEEVDDQLMTGTQIVDRISKEYSINPRLLLAIIEYQSGWVTNNNPRTSTLEYPLGWHDPGKKGLYGQMAWASNELNRGYYLWRVNAVSYWVLMDGLTVPVDPTINAGTAGVQHFLSLLYDLNKWKRAIAVDGLFNIYNSLFGYPFDYAFEPLLPSNLTQPVMQLPFKQGVVWAFTGGPHGGWGDGSAWAGIDFAPDSDVLGCTPSNEWVVAVSDGQIVRSGNGAVVQDIDESDGQPSDGFEQTGWTVLYLHIGTTDRVSAGTYLKAGENIGHPSCEGGYSTGTHVHIARRYNGEWIAADQTIPFILDGWVSSSAGTVYDGFLTQGNRTIEAWNGRSPENEIHR